MNIDLHRSKSQNGDSIGLVLVQVDPITIKVMAGGFHLIGEDMEMPEDYFWTMTPGLPSKMAASGFIVRDRNAPGDCMLLVDEFEYGESDQRIDFDDGPYVLIHHLFDIHLDPGAIDLSDADCRISHIVPKPPEQEAED